MRPLLFAMSWRNANFSSFMVSVIRLWSYHLCNFSMWHDRIRYLWRSIFSWRMYDAVVCLYPKISCTMQQSSFIPNAFCAFNRFFHPRRLEHACQTASGTIHRLVEARTQSMRQVASLSVILNKAIQGMKALMERVDNVERVSGLCSHYSTIDGTVLFVSDLMLGSHLFTDCNSSICSRLKE